MFENVREYVDRVCIQEKRIPYIDLIVRQDHRELFRYYAGLSNVTGKEQLILYSASKPVTAFAAAKLAEEGRLDVSRKVADYLPEFDRVFVTGEDGLPRRPEIAMTVKHLLTMSAGFDYDFTTEPLKRLIAETEGRCTTRQVVDALIESPLRFEPGTRFYYSLCLDVLAAVIEEAAGMQFSEYVDRTFFAPLGMARSTFSNTRVTVADCLPTCLARKDGSIVPNEGHLDFVTYPNYESGGGGMKSTVEDYIRFADMLACGGVSEDGRRLLKAETIREFAALRQEEASIQETFGCIQGDAYGYGYGLRVRKVPTAWGLPVGEFGWDGAFGSYVMVDPVRHVSVFIGMNVLGWPNVFRGNHLEIVREIYGNL